MPNELMDVLKTYDWGGDRGALSVIDTAIVAAHKDPQKLAEIEQALLEVVQSDAKEPAKEYSCRKLALVGTARSVPVLIGMLSDAALLDRALFALQAIPDGTVDDALRAALDGASGKLRVGIVNTLGERRDEKSVTLLSELGKNPDKVLSAAVESALRKIGAPA